MSPELSSTFSNTADRITFILAESQLIAFGVIVSMGAALIWWRPTIPGMPPIVLGWFAALLLLGPPLFGLFVTGARKLRNRNMVPVHYINGVDDVREKLYVEPEVWASKTVEGPSPYAVNDGDAFEVREFDWQEDTETLVVTGCYFSKMADSKLITVKAMLEDIHGDLIDTSIRYNQLRGRISKMGVEIEHDTINFQAEADERGLMGAKTSVKERFEAAEDAADDWETDEIRDVESYEEGYVAEHGPAADPEPRLHDTVSRPQAATDGGIDHGG